MLLRASLFAFSLAALTPAARVAGQTPLHRVEALLAEARELQAQGKAVAARARVARALERSPDHLGALRLEADLALAVGDRDAAVHAMHRWLRLVDAARRPPVPARDRRALLERLVELDPEARTWERLQGRYLRELHGLARDYRRRKDLLAALEVYAHVLEVDPEDRTARRAIAEIRRTGGREVAVEDVFAGADPGFGMTPEQIAAMDAKHTDWENAYTKETENYRYRTNAGYLVLETAAIAMEQMNRFYRRFFHYKEDGGKTPKIEIRIFKSREEYLTLGRHPAPWSAGHFVGDAVETYVGGVTGKESVRSMYRTLFHEAAHQFVSLTGGAVPGWLNEAYASFFEGCVILSNGSVVWNRVPAGRLFPLARRMERGWMRDASDGVRDAEGEWREPERAPRFRTVVAGGYAWGPPWYAPTWGVVYFLYNYRDAQGRPVYRAALRRYYESFRRGRPQDPIASFEETVLRGSPLSEVRTIDELDPIWKAWILRLRDRETGKVSAVDELEHFGDKALERGEQEAALSLYEEALEERPGDLALLGKLAALHEKLGQRARAAARYRELKRELELAGETDDPRYTRAVAKIARLDPLAGRYARIKDRLAREGLALARGYEERGLPTMALEIARRMSASFSIPEALELYVAIAKRTGKSLARWRVAYDEHSLRGWSGGDGAYQAYGEMIRAELAPSEREYETRELVYDTPFEGDYSLEAEVRAAAGARFVGLCFGRKDDQNLFAVILHPAGFLDVVAKRGGTWKTLDHRTAGVGDAWRRLRIDVVGRTLDVYLDGYYVRSLEMPSPRTLRGGFGLITGAGRTWFRNVRVLARDRHDPAARIERELAMARIAENPDLRQPGSFAGRTPPALRVACWVQGDPVRLEDLRGRPVLLMFWTPAQDRVIPTAAYYAHLLRRGAPKGLAAVAVADSGVDPDDLRAYLQAHPLPGAHVAIDAPGNATLEAYWIKKGGHGLPRVLLLDREGRVVFEGDPGLRRSEPWTPETRTYLDDAFEELLSRRN